MRKLILLLLTTHFQFNITNIYIIYYISHFFIFAGIQLLFARDCATTHSEEGCIVRNITDGKEIRLINVCFRTCASSGCNSESLSPRGASNRLSPPYSLSYMIVFFLLLSACINNCYQAVAAQIN